MDVLYYNHNILIQRKSITLEVAKCMPGAYICIRYIMFLDIQPKQYTTHYDSKLVFIHNIAYVFILEPCWMEQERVLIDNICESACHNRYSPVTKMHLICV